MKAIKEKIKLLTNPNKKKMIETVLIFVVVLGNAKFIPIVGTNVNARKAKQPPLSSILFSL